MHNAYGSANLLSVYCGLTTRDLKRIPLIWQHGWIPETLSVDVDLIVSESGETSELLQHRYLVSRLDQERFLRRAGVPFVSTVGLPFVYALETYPHALERNEGSLLVMPGDERHINERGEQVNLDPEYIEYLRTSSSTYSEIVVLLRQSQFDRGRHLVWKKAGFDVRQGAGEDDPTSLKRLVSIFSRFETMTTNGFSSAIPYAAASGCRVSISGPRPRVPDSAIFLGEIVRNRPELGPHYLKFYRPEMLETTIGNSALFKDPDEAVTAREWGWEQIGGDKKKSAAELRGILIETLERLRTSGSRRKSARTLAIPASVGSSIRLGRRPLEGEPLGFSGAAFSNLIRISQSSRKPSSFHVSTLGHRVWLRPRTADLRNAVKYFCTKSLGRLELGDPARILDLGSHVGCSLLYFMNRFPEAEVTGVEAWRGNFELLQENLRNREGVTLLNAALWSQTGIVSVLPATGKETTATVTDYYEGLDAVESFSLHDLFAKLKWNRAHLVKMNIEGAEYPTLLSAQDQIPDLCDVLLVKFHNTFARRQEYESITEELVSKGARVEELGEFSVFRFRH